MSFDTLILNGLVVDGTGAPAFYGDLGISGGRIVRIGNLKGARADEVIDAAGKIVAPGHVTQHAHYDAALFWDPYCSNSGEHGVTTILNANCGFGLAPVRPADRERTMVMLSTTEQIPVEQQRIALPWDWETFPQYLERLRALPKGVNVMTFLPLNPLLVYVMGVEGAKTRRPTSAEIAEMRRLIHEAMDLGAIGVSMSVMGLQGNSHLDFDGTCMPSDAMHDEDVVEIVRAVAERGEGVIQMLSQIAHYGNRALTEKVARMAQGSGARVLHNIVLTAEQVPAEGIEELEWLDGLRAEGVDLTTATLLTANWVEAGIRDLDTAAGQLQGVRDIIACHDDEAIRALISDPAFVQRFSDEYERIGPSNGAGGFEQQLVIDVGGRPELERFMGRSLAEIGEETGQTVVAALCDLALRSDLAVQFKSAPFAALNGTYAATLLRHPAVGTGVSDGGAHTKAFSTGNYGTDFLIRLVREQKLLTLEEAHFQLSLKVARLLGLQDRGALLPGFWADVVIYDLDALYFDRDRYEIVHDMPGGDWRRLAKSGGYGRILVNGQVTHADDRSTGRTPGRLLGLGDDHTVGLATAAE